MTQSTKFGFAALALFGALMPSTILMAAHVKCRAVAACETRCVAGQACAADVTR